MPTNDRPLDHLVDGGPSVPPHQKIELVISVKTIAKILAIGLLVYLVILLFPLMTTMFLAVMLAVTMYPLLAILKKNKVPNWAAISLIIFGIALTTSLTVLLVVPPLIDQSKILFDNLPHLQQQIAAMLPVSGPFHHLGTKWLHHLEVPEASYVSVPLLTAGQFVFGGAAQLGLILIFSVYFLSDGPKRFAWLLAFFSPKHRQRLHQTAREVSQVISAYVVGQIITSFICFIFTFAVLLALRVPAALTLAFLAGICDILPVLGFFIAAVPAVLLAVTVSPLTAVLVLALYVFYHAIENYYLVPKIYGCRLRLSDLVVLISLIAAGSIYGILGAIAILPIVASYPIIERIWLVDYVGRGVVRKHANTDISMPRGREPVKLP